MSNMEHKFLQKPINLYLSAEHDCSYLPDRQANSLFVDPEKEMTAEIYSELITQGFRRSGSYVYTPYCKKCHDCIPVRLNVQKFELSRSQKRCRNKNKTITVAAKQPVYDEAQYQLYSNYVTSRHPGGGMDEPANDKYLDFLTSQWSHTVFFEFRDHNKPMGVAVTDIVEDGLSAVYTFFDPSPDYQKQSPGVFSILWQIEEAQRRGLKWLYLGYWIKNCGKMSYKDNYQPLEYYYNHLWHDVPPGLL
ncbi:MAG: arginyltransferase [Gammaproteobacteria bacterium]|nr:arginyltransferase [Gammaproteobacteria bacterium]